MFKSLCQRITGLASAFLAVQKGSILIYTGAFMTVGVGGAAVSIDVGRVVLLRTQMQNRADAGALAGAAQLDAGNDAVTRSDTVARDSMYAFTTSGAATSDITVEFINFFAVDATDFVSKGLPTTVGPEARFIEVILSRKVLSFFYAPAAAMLNGETANPEVELGARAVAMSDPYICKAQPLMICNPYEATTDELGDFPGSGLLIKQSGQSGSWGSGNFGLLDLPGDVNYPGANGANAVQAALEAEEPLGCYAVSSLGTAPGNKSGKVKEGVNVRFGMPVTDGTVPPAPNVMNYPHDRVMDASDPLYDASINFGDGDWDLATYWNDRHLAADPTDTLPAALSSATRYQIYLYEQAQAFWIRNGKETSTAVGQPPSNGGNSWNQIIAGAPSIPTDLGDPDNNWVDGNFPVIQTVSTQGYERRTLKVAVVNCAANPPQGNTTVPGNGEYVEIFITEEAGGSGNGATIYGEVIGSLDALTSLEFHGNVRLVE